MCLCLCGSAEADADCKLSAAEASLVEDSWRKLSAGTSPSFLAAKARDPGLSPVSHFYNTFYDQVRRAKASPCFVSCKQTSDVDVLSVVGVRPLSFPKLFGIIPEVKPLFTRAMKAQGRMLANVVKFIVSKVRDDDETFVECMSHE